MKGKSDYEWDDYQELDQTGEVSVHGGRVWISGVHITPLDRPVCLKRDCGCRATCSFFDPACCPLRRDSELRYDLRLLLDMSLERFAAAAAAKQQLVRAVLAELRTHGRPLHYTVLSRMVADRHRYLYVTESRVLGTLKSFPGIFEKTGEGVYQVR